MKHLKLYRNICAWLSFCGFAGSVVMASISDSGGLSFFQLVIFTVILVFIGLLFGVEAMEMGDKLKEEEDKLSGNYRKDDKYDSVRNRRNFK